MKPETALNQVQPDNMMLSFQTNAMGPLLVCQRFVPLLSAASKGQDTSVVPPAVVANMSARVGSIGDNGFGGWYSYRASKAALNQLTRTLSIEWKRRKMHIACVLLHPGTCDTGAPHACAGKSAAGTWVMTSTARKLRYLVSMRCTEASLSRVELDSVQSWLQCRLCYGTAASQALV